MKQSMKKSILAAAVSLGLGLGIAGNVQAVPLAYAFAGLDINNLVITGTNTTFVLPSGISSAATACLPAGTCVNGGGAGQLAGSAQIGAPGAIGSFSPVGDAFGNSYSRAEAAILSQQTGGGPFTHVNNIAEGLLLETNTANADAGNSSGTVFTAQIVIGTPTSLNFSFDATAQINAELLGAVGVPSQAEGIIASSINITDNTGATVFIWSPDGTGARAILNGVVAADPFSLNTSRKALPGLPGPLSYTVAAAHYDATSTILNAGTYTLNLSEQKRTNLQLTTVPEPAALALMGLGLTGLGFIRRRKMA